MRKVRVSYWWYALLVLGCSHMAYADEAANDDAASMEVIEMLGEMDGEVADLEIAMSDVKVAETEAGQDVNADEKTSAQEVKNVK
jgi:hypothetical protein